MPVDFSPRYREIRRGIIELRMVEHVEEFRPELKLCAFANRNRFEGTFADNLYQGQGSMAYANGDRFDGNYERGIKQGYGVYRFANGDRYEGNLVNNLFSGQGKLFLANGDRYEGGFSGNVKEHSRLLQVALHIPHVVGTKFTLVIGLCGHGPHPVNPAFESSKISDG